MPTIDDIAAGQTWVGEFPLEGTVQLTIVSVTILEDVPCVVADQLGAGRFTLSVEDLLGLYQLAQ